MGLATWWRIRRMREPVRGSLKVTVCAQPETALSAASYGAIVMGVVSATGFEPTAVEFSTTIISSRCPRSGQRVPVMVDRTNPRRIAILWKDVPRRNVLGAARGATQSAARSQRRSR
jgi:hypothetical protein